MTHRRLSNPWKNRYPPAPRFGRKGKAVQQKAPPSFFAAIKKPLWLLLLILLLGLLILLVSFLPALLVWAAGSIGK